jgi:hypothetical protein
MSLSRVDAIAGPRWSVAAGYLASALVASAYCMKDIIPLRIVALGSNVAFLANGIARPVWLLHPITTAINKNPRDGREGRAIAVRAR